MTDPAGKVITNATPAGYGPADLQAAYNVAHTASVSGTGPLIAIVDAYGYPNAERDLGVYRKQYFLPPCTTANLCFSKVNQNGTKTSYPQSNANWDLEQALDLEMVSAICPECRILLVEANSDSVSDLGLAEDKAAFLGAHAISNSYGGPEAGTVDNHYNHTGIAITASSGDSGYYTDANHTLFPATSPHVIAVGGTSLHRSNGVYTETVWSGAGSGCSQLYSNPPWQHDPLCGAKGHRMVADVSAVGDPNTGVAVYGPVAAFGPFVITGWAVVGGTSVGAPIIAAMYGLNGGAVGNYGLAGDPWNGYGSDPYALAGGWPYASNLNLNEITSGKNGSCGSSYLCTAGPFPTYSGPAGLGTPNGDDSFGANVSN